MRQEIILMRREIFGEDVEEEVTPPVPEDDDEEEEEDQIEDLDIDNDFLE